MLVDIVCGIILIIFALYGVFKGFARQVFKTVSFLVALFGALLLIKPVYDLLYGFPFFKGWVSDFANTINGWVIDIPFWAKVSEFFKLEDFAKQFNKTIGLLLSEYAYRFGLFIILIIVLSLVVKLLKLIIFPIADMPVIVVFDRILGLALGLLWATVIIVGGLLIINLLTPNIAAVKDWAAVELSDSHLIGKFLYPHISTIGEYLWTIILFIAGKIKIGG